MSRKRVFTDEECKQLAEWAASRGSMKDKAKELNVSVGALRDAILRGEGKDPGYIRRKIQTWLTSVPRETDDKSQITPAENT
jgi:hypothetical protein